jgi:hypothetical protein
VSEASRRDVLRTLLLEGAATAAVGLKLPTQSWSWLVPTADGIAVGVAGGTADDACVAGGGDNLR